MIHLRGNLAYHLMTKKEYPNYRFRRDLRDRWGTIESVRLGRRDFNPHLMKWCRENLHGEYAHSEGLEVYYFGDAQDALMFKIRFL